MLPREHGAYGQLAFPLITALVVGGVTASALLIAAAVVAGFLAHEPLMVLLGRRGQRVRSAESRRATAWLLVTGSVAVVAGLAALGLVPPGIRWSFLLPLAPAALLAASVAFKREKAAIGEIAAAAAFSFAAIPLCLAAGTSLSAAVAVGVAFLAVFAASTLGVRVIILTVRGGGNPRSVRATRRVLILLAMLVVSGLAAAAAADVLPWTTLAAVSPGLIVALALAVRPPPASRLRTVGWTLVSASAATAAILIAGLISSA